jgi:CheY-like chemotaxis protein
MQLSGAKQAIYSLVRRLDGLGPEDRERMEAELAEILLYLIRSANRVGVDLVAVACQQIVRDAKSQPSAVPDGKAFAAVDALPAHRPLRILIVEDERIVAADLQEVLNGLGYDAYAIASNGAEALTMASGTRPDIALMDIRIGGEFDGIEAAAKLRREFGTAVIFVTALADDATLQRAKNSEPSAYLIKPVSVRALKAAIELTAHRQRRAV